MECSTAPTNGPESPKSSTVYVDHSYSLQESPKAVKRKLTEALDHIDNLQKMLKTTHQKSRRLQKVTSLQEVVKSLKEKQFVSDNGAEMLSKTYSDIPSEMLERILTDKTTGKLSRDTYPPVLRAFALTLHFYSEKAYKYVRKSFDFVLPLPSTIRKWYSGVNGQPGFTQEAFSALKLKVEEAKEKQSEVVCALMIGEMAIRKYIEWGGAKFHGYVDIGVGIQDDTNSAAQDALVLMVVALNGNWKIPVGYFLINGMTGQERANLIQQCLIRLHNVGVHCVSLTCDGPSCHLTMLQELGAMMHLPNLHPSFPHPSNPDHRVFVLLDICHMLKLIRNTLTAGWVITSPDGGKITWRYVKEFHKLQEEVLRLGNKLKVAHVEWEKQKMKVNLDAQALSSSVADAIEYCNKELKLPQFWGSEATVEFIRYIDRLFDMMNSRNPLARNFKAPLRMENEQHWRGFLQQAYTYLSQLTHADGQLMHLSRRKTPFIGFLAGIKSLQGLFETLVKCDPPKLKHLLTYKLSQDHVELFFCAVRSANGTNNNPTARQFEATYKRLLVRHEIGQGSTCIAQDKTPILHVSSAKPSGRQDGGDINTEERDMLLVRRYDWEDHKPCAEDSDYLDAPNVSSLSPVMHAAIVYIAGYVVRMAKQRMPCLECQGVLTSCGVDAGGGLMKKKNRGGLVKPSDDVVKVCNSAERCLQRLLRSTDSALPQSAGIACALATAVLHEVGSQRLFTELADHMLDCPPDHNHIFVLIKCIAACYIKIRMHHLAKRFTEKLTGPKLRQQLSKLILFRHG